MSHVRVASSTRIRRSDKKTAGNFGCEYMDVDDFVDKYKD